MKITKHMISIVLLALIAATILFALAGREGGASAPPQQYQVLHANDIQQLETLLNTQSRQGWRLHSYSSGVVIFVK